MTWALLGLVGLTARVPKKATTRVPQPPATAATPPVPEPASSTI